MKPPVFIGLLLTIGAFLAPAVPFIIDGGVYLDMVDSLVRNHSLAIGGNGGVEGAPPLTKLLTIAHNGQVYPQYPSGYAFIAAPFYLAFGVSGLMMLNGLCFALSIWLTYLLSRRFYSDETARLAAGVFAFATFAPTYMLAIWPHMIALAFWLGAVYLAVAADEAQHRKKSLLLFGLSGLLVGAGLNVRVDVFLAGLIVFFWLRLAARPGDRMAALLVLCGVAPGLLAAAVLNEMKFGAFLPLSYGKTAGLTSFAPYLPLAMIGVIAFLAAWAFNIPALLKTAHSKIRNTHAGAITVVFIACVLLAPPLRDLVWRMLTGIYVLVFNLQAHNAYFQDGVEPNVYGQLLFWGYPKKALIQSIPWMALAIIPLVYAFRTRIARAASLSALAIAAPICFYALNQWHGGGSYSMRYFLPALPFLAMLSAEGFRRLSGDIKLNRQAILAALLAAAALYLGLQELGQTFPRLFVPAALYPQWIIAALLAVLIVLVLFTNNSRMRKACVATAVFAFAYALAINVYEEVGHERTRAEQKVRAADSSAPLPAGSLVITPMQTSLIPAERRGVFVMAAAEKTAREAGLAAEAFARAGRCVYFHNSLAAKLVKDHLISPLDPSPLRAPSKRYPNDPRLEFFVFADSPEACRFQQ